MNIGESGIVSEEDEYYNDEEYSEAKRLVDDEIRQSETEKRIGYRQGYPHRSHASPVILKW